MVMGTQRLHFKHGNAAALLALLVAKPRKERDSSSFRGHTVGDIIVILKLQKLTNRCV